MNRRSFLRFLGISPALSVVDMTEMLERQARPKLKNTMMACRDDMHTQCIDPYSWMLDPAAKEWLEESWPAIIHAVQIPPESGRNLK